MKRLFLLIALLLIGCTAIWANRKKVTIKIIHTSDVHGYAFPENLLEGKPWAGSYARIASFVKEQRAQYPEAVVLLDGGDILQGQPSAYYYNFVDTCAPHLFASIFNLMNYDAITIGNHDIETGHNVYDRWIAQCNCPVLGANVLRNDSSHYLPPYTIIERQGVRIAVLGLITPAIPMWVPEKLWEGLLFTDIVKTAEYWIPYIQEHEHPDLLIGLFHSGLKNNNNSKEYNENASLETALNVPGFDLLLIGHDHRPYCKEVTNIKDKNVWIVDPANNGKMVSNVTVDFTIENDKVTHKTIKGELTKMDSYEPDSNFMRFFDSNYQVVKEFIQKPIGSFSKTINSADAYFGPSDFIDFIHQVQLEISGADISFAAPLSFNTQIRKGGIFVKDLFKLYKYENMLYTMELSGKEIKDYLEYSYSLWVNQMESEKDDLLLFDPDRKNHLKNPIYNFDSAAGICYTVDVTKPKGERIRILKMMDGSPFVPDRKYRVAINSYRGNGGGGLLTLGAGIPQEQLKKRIIQTTEHDFRFLMMQYIQKKGTINPKSFSCWKFIPEKWTIPAAKRDYKRLFN